MPILPRTALSLMLAYQRSFPGVSCASARRAISNRPAVRVLCLAAAVLHTIPCLAADTGNQYCSASTTSASQQHCKRPPSTEKASTPVTQETRRFSTGMAWRANAKDNEDLIDQLLKHNVVQSKRVEEAMRAIDRGNYVSKTRAYQDAPQTIGYHVTISAPHMHAYALHILEDHLKPGMTALDVGSGSGYLASCMAQMVGPTGRVVGIDHVKELVDMSVTNVKKGEERQYLEDGRMKLVVGDGRQGFADAAPFDAIHVGAAAAEVPKALLEQLKEGGRLVIPVGPEHGDQSLDQADKLAGGEIKWERLMGVRYVPLTSLDHQLGH
eukprot:scpid72333/ scgid16974/ Protein-L-isoaspartate(D-aspartate) O-methyltransferase; L-isoaspartyl protein carboxyl methyltransferase; Protein L-isoaspartyl/D-aspartyl methyltransferase; Protein-beta-aspartate methyltransferase